MLRGILVIKCPVNRGRFTKPPEDPEGINMIAEGINNALTHLFGEISLLNWFSD